MSTSDSWALPRRSASLKLRALHELAKPNLTNLVVLTGVLGFWLGSIGQGPFDWVNFSSCVIGLIMTSAAACAANMVAERDVDALMRRTAQRPIPSGRVTVTEATAFASFNLAAGVGLLWFGCGPLPAMLALGTFVTYVFIYTPMKRRGGVAIAIGAIPGAVPPVIGWAAAHGSVGWQAWLLFALLFAWQYPHFLALAYMYRADYARGGFWFLPPQDRLQRAGAAMGVGCVLTLLASVFPAFGGLAGPVYGIGAVAAGCAFCVLGFRAASRLDAKSARSVFLGSIAYLPVLLALTVVDRLLTSG